MKQVKNGVFVLNEQEKRKFYEMIKDDNLTEDLISKQWKLKFAKFSDLDEYPWDLLIGKDEFGIDISWDCYTTEFIYKKFGIKVHTEYKYTFTIKED